LIASVATSYSGDVGRQYGGGAAFKESWSQTEAAMDLTMLGKEPIYPDQPCGSDMGYDHDFEQLQAEVDRISLPSVAGAVDWEKVVGLASEILFHKSKDLRVAGYLSVGLIHIRKLEGLATALKIYGDLLEYGVGLFPERQRARLRSVEWWLEKSEMAFSALDDCPIDADQLVAMQKDVEKISQLLGELLPEAPSLQILQRFLYRAPQVPPANALDQIRCANNEDAPEVSLQEPIPSVVDQFVPAEFDAAKATEEQLRSLRETATKLRQQDPANPYSYRFYRHACWMAVVDLPPAKAGRTLLVPPSCEVREQLASLRNGGDSIAMLHAVESRLDQFIFWLDLNLLAAEALADMGGAQAAVAAVRQETSFLLQRLPGLVELSFADGSPFAGAETRHWLKTILPERGENKAAECSQNIEGRQQELDVLLQKELDAASALINEGKLVEGIDRFQERLKSNSSERERFRWRLALSRLLMDAEQTRFALPHLEQVVTDIDRYRLEEYDPAIALEALKLAWHGFESHPERGSKPDAQDVLHRIARIDLAEMVRLSQR
jgi:type VI secretion system protein VasJ